MDGTLIETWTSQRSLKKQDDESYKGQSCGRLRNNDYARFKNGSGVAFIPARGVGLFGHVLMENRNGLIVEAMVTQAAGRATKTPRSLIMHHCCSNGFGQRHYEPVSGEPIRPTARDSSELCERRTFDPT